MIQIPQPCHKKWENLSGDDQQRFCTSCEKYVYNLNGLSSSDLNNLMERESKVCGMITTKKQSVSLTTKLRLTFLGLGLFIANVFGQQDSIQVKGRVLDDDGLPVENAKVNLKNFPLNTLSNDSGEFILNVPVNLGTYILEAQNVDDFNIDVVFKEDQLKDRLIIPLKQSNNIIMGSVVIESYKPTFKQRVINTITWPYRIIRQTIFNN